MNESQVWALEAFLEYMEIRGITDPRDVLREVAKTGNALIAGYSRSAITVESLTQTLALALGSEQKCDRVIQFCWRCIKDPGTPGPDFTNIQVFRAAVLAREEAIAVSGIQGNTALAEERFDISNTRFGDNPKLVARYAAKKNLPGLLVATRHALPGDPKTIDLVKSAVRGGSVETTRVLLKDVGVDDEEWKKYHRDCNFTTCWADVVMFGDSVGVFGLLLEYAPTPSLGTLNLLFRWSRSVEMVKYLVSLGVDIPNGICGQAETPESLAALIAAGADPSYIHEDGTTTLIASVRSPHRHGNYSHMPLILLAMDIVDVNAQTFTGCTALDGALINACVTCTRALLNAGADVNISTIYNTSFQEPFRCFITSFAVEFARLREKHLCCFKVIIEEGFLNQEATDELRATCTRILENPESDILVENAPYVRKILGLLENSG